MSTFNAAVGQRNLILWGHTVRQNKTDCLKMNSHKPTFTVKKKLRPWRFMLESPEDKIMKNCLETLYFIVSNAFISLPYRCDPRKSW